MNNTSLTYLNLGCAAKTQQNSYSITYLELDQATKSEKKEQVEFSNL